MKSKYKQKSEKLNTNNTGKQLRKSYVYVIPKDASRECCRGNDFPCFEKQLVNTCGASITKLPMIFDKFKWTL